MVKALILSGFLGSGKTSLILRLGRYFAEEVGKKSVIIVNEIGEVGVDGDFLKKLGMNSYEITEGCICCTLRRDLESTLSEVISSFNPDYILIEPTGIAFPSVIRKTVIKAGIDAIVIGVADAKRFPRLYSDSKEFIERQLREVEIIALNKVDAVKRAELSLLVEILKTLSPNAKIVFTSAKTGEGLEELIKSIDLPSLEFEAKEEFLDSTVESKTSWYSSKFFIKFKKPISGIELKNLFIELMEELKNSSKDIQHYKMLLSTKNGVLKFGLTRKDDAVSVDGSIFGWVSDATLNVLLIERELNSGQIEKLFEGMLTEKSEEFGFEFEEHKHEEVHY